VEARSLAQMLTRTRSGALSPRELAAYPTFLRNPAINAILDRVSNLETRRTELLDRRTPNDPDVLVIERSIAQSEAQLLSLSTAYLEGLNTQQAQLRRELERYEGIRSALPAHAEISLRRQREVQRLSETLVALETQLVQARLAAITEGGDVRQIDAATAPRKASFPRPAVMVVLGLVGGLLFGSGAALTSGYFGSRVRIPREAELATGVPALALDAPGPLLLDDGSWKSVLVIPVGASSDSFSVAQRLAAAATLQGRNVVLADFRPARSLPIPGKSADEPLTGGEAAFETGRTEVAELSTGFEMFRANGRAKGAGARGTLGDLEARFATVIVALPPLEQAPTPALLAGERPVVLAARSGVTSRSDLRLASTALTRIGIRVAGVVLHSRDDVAPGD
jgi:Mrp family chromosome partitioning ATPase